MIAMRKTELLILAIYLGTFAPAQATCLSPDPRFVTHGNGAVTDTKTGLMWKRCAQAKSAVDCSVGTANAYGEPDALNVAKAEVFAGFDDWRIPNIKELKSIVARCSVGPRINLAAFPNAEPSILRSASYGGDYGTDNWYLNFQDGTALVEDGDVPRPLRLVRNAR